MHPSGIRFVGPFAVALVLGGCASLNVSTYVERDSDMRQYRTYNWAPLVERATGDPRLDNNKIFQEYVQTAIEHHLHVRGFRKGINPDVLVRYSAHMKQSIYIRGGAPPDPYCEECRPEAYDAGTLTIDLLDARTQRLVWRGWAEGSVDQMIDHQEWMEKGIDEAVARILRRL